MILGILCKLVTVFLAYYENCFFDHRPPTRSHRLYPYSTWEVDTMIFYRSGRTVLVSKKEMEKCLVFDFERSQSHPVALEYDSIRPKRSAVD